MNNIKDLAVILTQDGSEYSEPLSLGTPHEEETSWAVVKATPHDPRLTPLHIICRVKPA